jgi:5-methyltetrahydropteroyltriglutamate--homocysteine methyltransferase
LTPIYLTEEQLKTTVVGNYPKIPTERGQPNIRTALNRWEKGKLPKSELETTYEQTILRCIRDQEQAGIDIITDGQIRWDDIVTPMAKRIEGFEIGGLIRFFDNNVYYRKPIATAELRWKTPATLDDYLFARNHTTRRLKAVLPAPFTFACMSLDKHYGDFEAFVAALAEIVNKEALALMETGVEIIQFDDPFVAALPDQWDIAKAALETAVRNVTAKKVLQIYFGKIDHIWDKLMTFPVDVIGVDIVSHQANLETILRDGCDKELGLGCVEARNIRLETIEEISELIEQVAAVVPADRILVSPSCGLEFLPQNYAFLKMKTMVDAVHAVEGRQ